MMNRMRARTSVRAGLAALVIVGLLLGLSMPCLAGPPPPPDFTPTVPGDVDSGFKLIAPADGSYFKTSTTKFSFRAAIPTVASCGLYVDDVSKATFKDFDYTETYNRTVTVSGAGDHAWYLLCDETSGNQLQSPTAPFTIDTDAPALVLSSSSVEQGEFILYNGSHYGPGEVNITLSNTSAVVDASGEQTDRGAFDGRFFLRYDLPTGTYVVATRQNGLSGASKSASFTLAARTVLLFLDQDVYFPGQTIEINGSGFSAGGLVQVLITKPDGSTYTRGPHALSDGSFSLDYALTGNRATGTYTVTATDARYGALAATASFTVADESPANDDYDADGVPNTADNCPYKRNADQLDTDGDGIGDVCDATPMGTPDPTTGDYDGDGVKDSLDNCPVVANPLQTDKDGDNIGDACDPKDDSNVTPIDDPGIQEPSAGFPWLLVILGALFAILLGTLGFLMAEGKLDLNDLPGSFAALLHPEARGSGKKASPAQLEELKAFIFGQRSRGVDDLAIRNALVQRGWGEHDVDSVFQQLYEE